MQQDDAYDGEIARLDALKGTGHELDGFERVKATIVKGQRDTFTLRLGTDELAEIAGASAVKGQTLGDFIRQAALNQARSGSQDSGRRWLEPPVAEALDELIKRVGAQEQQERRRRRRPTRTTRR